MPRMIDDALRLTIDVLFDTKYNFNNSCNVNSNSNLNSINLNDVTNNNKENKEVQEYQSPFPVKNYSNSENLW